MKLSFTKSKASCTAFRNVSLVFHRSIKARARAAIAAIIPTKGKDNPDNVVPIDARAPPPLPNTPDIIGPNPDKFFFKSIIL